MVYNLSFKAAVDQSQSTNAGVKGMQLSLVCSIVGAARLPGFKS